MKPIVDWLTTKWRRPAQPELEPARLLHAYGVTFGSPQGQVVLQHLLDQVYCTVYEGTDPQAALVHNARRSVVHEILESVDQAEAPGKYRLTTETEAVYAVAR